MIENEMDKLFQMQRALQVEEIPLQQLAKEFQIEYQTVCAWARIGLLTVSRSHQSSERTKKGGLWGRGRKPSKDSNSVGSDSTEGYYERTSSFVHDSAEDCAGNK